MLITNGAVVKGESLYLITGKKQLQAQALASKNIQPQTLIASNPRLMIA